MKVPNSFMSNVARNRKSSSFNDLEKVAASSKKLPHGNGITNKASSAISVVDGPKGAPITRDAVVLKASTLTSAFSTASEGELLACGLTSDELEDLENAAAIQGKSQKK